MSAVNQGALAFAASPFKFESHLVRVVMRDEDPWFIAADVCQALNLDATSIRKLDDDEKGLHSMQTLGGNQSVSIISESGLYTLILRCRDAIKPGTVPYRFRRWVTHEVLPSIRKTGAYGTPRVDPEELLLSDLLALTLPLPPNVQRALDFRAWQLAGEAHGLIHEHLRRRVASDAMIGYPEKYIDEDRALNAISNGDLGDALAYCWAQKMSSLIVYAEVQAAAAAECVAKMRAAIEP